MAFRRPQFILTATFLTNFWVGMVAVVVPVCAKEQMGVSATMLGLYGSLPMVFYIAAAMIGGRLSDRYGRRGVMVGSLALTAVAVTGIGYALESHRPYFLFAPLILHWFALGMFWPGVEASMGDDQKPSQIQRATGHFNVTWMSAMMLGSALGGWFYWLRSRHELGFSPSIVLALVLIAAVLAMLLALPRALEIVPWGREREEPKAAHASPDRQALFVRLGLLGNMASFLMLISYRSLLPEYTNTIGIAGWQYGLLQASVVAGMVIFNLMLMHWRGWHYRLRYLLGAELIGVGLLLGFVACDRYEALLVLAFLLGGPIAVTYFSSIYYGLEQLEAKGDHCGDHEAVLAAGGMFGPALGGLAIYWGGIWLGHPTPKAFLVLGAAVYLLTVVVQGALAWRRLGRGR
ncbi:MFS transporter [Candidatus Sumerlaeota bacterium]|nr:MFS transporter [Candidatus Sumerlaeota bacterium]